MPRQTAIHVAISSRVRQPGRLDWPANPELPFPSVEEVVASVAQCPPRTLIWLGGGEPTLHPDLPRLISALAAAGHRHIGLDTDGLALVSPAVLMTLRRAGLRCVRIALHCSRSAAHDWLVGLSGAARRVRKAIQMAARQGLAVEGSVTVTRPTTDHLTETVQLLGRLGATSIRLRRLQRRGSSADSFITLSPRIGLLEPFLETAVEQARSQGLAIRLEGFSLCAAPRVPTALFHPRDVVWTLPGLGALERELSEPPARRGCRSCPGASQCPGAPARYVDCFGRTEFESEGIGTKQRLTQPALESASPPPPRQGRKPATRLRSIHRQLDRFDLWGDPLRGLATDPREESLRVVFSGTSRQIRLSLIRVAQEGASTLRIADRSSLAHPDAIDLLRDSTRLSFERIEVAGDLDQIADVSDRDLVGLRSIARFEAVLDGPTAELHDTHTGRAGAFARTLDLLGRLSQRLDAEIGCIGFIDDSLDDTTLAAWSEIPFPISFRLAPAGGDLQRLAERIARLEAGSLKDSLAALLPSCLHPSKDRLPPLAGHSQPPFGLPPGLAPETTSDLRIDHAICTNSTLTGCRGPARNWTLSPGVVVCPTFVTDSTSQP